MNHQVTSAHLDDSSKCSYRRPLVAILLSTYNGERYLTDQIDSIVRQSHEDWVIHASDDGSSDSTLAILELYQKKLGTKRLVLHRGPENGFSANFLSLIRKNKIDADYYAFCDQDDIWTSERLVRGISWMAAKEDKVPLLHCSRTRLVDEKGKPIGLSPLYKAPLRFENALVQSIAGGNTMLFNEAARQLLAKTNKSDQIISHDWWIYILVTGCGGEVYYDPSPAIDYRQHSENLIGSNKSLKSRLLRLRGVLKGTFKEWNDSNLAAIPPIQGHLTLHNQMVLELFTQARSANLLRRLHLARKSGIYRQTLQGNLGLFLATLLKRI